MRQAPRSRLAPELSRGRSRTLFFAALFVAAAILGDAPAGVLAATGGILGWYSIKIARARGASLALTFVTLDWLLLGLLLISTGGAHSWFLLAVPPLMAAELLPAKRREWPYLIVPSLLTAIVMAIADPSLGGHRAVGLGTLALLAVAGVAAAARLRRSRPRRRAATAIVDPTTGFYTALRARPAVANAVDEAAADHTPMALICVRLDHFRDTHDFHGEATCETIVRAVARRLRRHLQADDLCFRLRSDTLLFALPGRDLRAARTVAVEMRHDVAGQLIERHKQTTTTGVAACPPLHDADDLLDEALRDLRGPERLPLAASL